MDIQIQRIAALAVNRLQRLLHVEQKPGEVFDQAHVALDEEDLLREDGVAGMGLDVGRQRVAGSVAPLRNRFVREARQVVAVVETDLARLVVFFPDYPGGVKMRGVSLRA